MVLPAWDAYKKADGEIVYLLYIGDGGLISRVHRNQHGGWEALRPGVGGWKHFSSLSVATQWADSGVNAPSPNLDWENLPEVGSDAFYERKLSDGTQALEVAWN